MYLSSAKNIHFEVIFYVICVDKGRKKIYITAIHITIQHAKMRNKINSKSIKNQTYVKLEITHYSKKNTKFSNYKTFFLIRT